MVSFLHRSVVRYHAASGKYLGVFAASAAQSGAQVDLDAGSALQALDPHRPTAYLCVMQRFFYQKRLKVEASEQRATLSPGKGWLVCAAVRW